MPFIYELSNLGCTWTLTLKAVSVKKNFCSIRNWKVTSYADNFKTSG